MLDIAVLAASAVNLLAPFLKKAAEKGVEKLGESTAGTLYKNLKHKLRSTSGQEALADLEKAPEDVDSQAALRLQIRKAAEQDPELAKVLNELLSKAGQPTQSQVANVDGSGNRVNQVQGAGNVIS